MRVFVKFRRRRKGEFQFFMHDFVDVCLDSGIQAKPDFFPSYRWHIRALLREIALWSYKLFHRFLPGLLKRKSALIVTANGVSLPDNVFPYYGCCEIVPMLWDVWPSTWRRMYQAFRLFDVRTVFVTSSQVAEMINKETDVKAYWIPEGINAKQYYPGDMLAQRKYDVAEIGRQMPRYHNVLTAMARDGKLNGLITSNIRADGTLDEKNVAFSNEELHRIISDSKIMVCFPQCDTNPNRGGNVETLTTRYWEAMLSRCVIVGRCPKELSRFIGYNPVIDVDWKAQEEQILDILNHVSSYQLLVDRNFETAKKLAPWGQRMPLIKKYLKEEGYEI